MGGLYTFSIQILSMTMTAVNNDCSPFDHTEILCTVFDVRCNSTYCVWCTAVAILKTLIVPLFSRSSIIFCSMIITSGLVDSVIPLMHSDLLREIPSIFIFRTYCCSSCSPKKDFFGVVLLR